MQKDTKRNFALDVLRVLACYMVIQVHTGEFYYIGPIGDVIKGENAFWVDLYNSVCRSAVPLFVMLTGYFLLPVKDEPAQFFRKRFTRVVIPFIFWCIAYSFYQFFRGQVDFTTACTNILKIPVNFGTQVGHLWYVYMLMGLYLFAPIISPWLKNSFSKEHRAISWNMGVYFVRALYPSVISGYIRGMLLERDSDVILFLRAAGIYGISLLSTHICFRTEKLEPAGGHRFIGSGLFHHLVRLLRTVIDSRICPSIGNHLGIRDNQRGNGGYRYFPVDQEYPDQEPRFILRKVSYGYID